MFSSEAGTLTATCSAPDTVEILTHSARKPFKVTSVEPAAVTFKHGKQAITMAVTCQDNNPSVA